MRRLSDKCATRHYTGGGKKYSDRFNIVFFFFFIIRMMVQRHKRLLYERDEARAKCEHSSAVSIAKSITRRLVGKPIGKRETLPRVLCALLALYAPSTRPSFVSPGCVVVQYTQRKLRPNERIVREDEVPHGKRALHRDDCSVLQPRIIRNDFLFSSNVR